MVMVMIVVDTLHVHILEVPQAGCWTPAPHSKFRCLLHARQPTPRDQPLLPLAPTDMTPRLVQYFRAALDELGLGGGPCRPARLPLQPDEPAHLKQAVAQDAPAKV